MVADEPAPVDSSSYCDGPRTGLLEARMALAKGQSPQVSKALPHSFRDTRCILLSVSPAFPALAAHRNHLRQLKYRRQAPLSEIGSVGQGVVKHQYFFLN